MKTGISLCGKSTQGKPCSGPVLALYGIAVYEFNVSIKCTVLCDYSLLEKLNVLFLLILLFSTDQRMGNDF